MSRPGSTCHRLNPLSSDGRVTGEIDDLSASWARDSLCAVEISADRDRIDRELVHRFLSGDGNAGEYTAAPASASGSSVGLTVEIQAG